MINLDQLFPSPPGLAWVKKTTLLNYAAWRGADAITGALLRAGADASIRWDDLPCGAGEEVGTPADGQGEERAGGGGGSRHEDHVAMSENAAAALATLLPRAAVWTLNKVVSMREAAATDAGGVRGAQSVACCRVKWLACGHVTCEACVWADLRSKGKLVCRCGTACSEVQEEEAEVASWAERTSEECEARKEESRTRWLSLPEDIHGRQQETKAECLGEKIPRFAAMPPAEVAKLYIGGTRAQRQKELWKAARKDDVHRIRALVSAGADVDGRNEYGQTALYLAAMHNATQAVCDSFIDSARIE